MVDSGLVFFLPSLVFRLLNLSFSNFRLILDGQAVFLALRNFSTKELVLFSDSKIQLSLR